MGTHNTYVSTEIAKLLKKLGFDWECYSQFQDIHPLDNTCSGIEDCHPAKNWNAIGNHVSVPTLAVAQQWLREVKDIDINIEISTANHSTIEYSYWIWLHSTNSVSQVIHYDCIGFAYNQGSYEEALEAAILKCLSKLLEENI